MKKIKYSDFESVAEIISQMDFNFNSDTAKIKEEFFLIWDEIVGDKLAQYSKPVDIKENGTMIVLCANSFIANELAMIKSHLLSLIEEKTRGKNLKITNLFFDYKNWKNQCG